MIMNNILTEKVIQKTFIKCYKTLRSQNKIRSILEYTSNDKLINGDYLKENKEFTDCVIISQLSYFFFVNIIILTPVILLYTIYIFYETLTSKEKDKITPKCKHCDQKLGFTYLFVKVSKFTYFIILLIIYYHYCIELLNN